MPLCLQFAELVRGTHAMLGPDGSLRGFTPEAMARLEARADKWRASWRHRFRRAWVRTLRRRNSSEDSSTSTLSDSPTPLHRSSATAPPPLLPITNAERAVTSQPLHNYAPAPAPPGRAPFQLRAASSGRRGSRFARLVRRVRSKRALLASSKEAAEAPEPASMAAANAPRML